MEDLKLAKEFQEAKDNILAEIWKVVVGQDEVIKNLLISLFSRGHSLLVGVPGLAKTLLVSTLAKLINI